MRILIACEESQTITKEFRKRGHEAFSCDIIPCSGGHPEWHIQQDVLEILNENWDLLIAHPPCTYLSHAGARWLYPKKILNEERYKKGIEAKDFFMKLWNSGIKYICVENPVPSKVYGMPEHSQVIQPYLFGDSAQKKTLLWIKNLPLLQPTNIVDRGEFVTYKSGKKKAKWFMDAAKNSKERAKIRSKTFCGIAEAMAVQWGEYISLAHDVRVSENSANVI